MTDVALFILLPCAAVAPVVLERATENEERKSYVAGKDHHAYDVERRSSSRSAEKREEFVGVHSSQSLRRRRITRAKGGKGVHEKCNRSFCRSRSDITNGYVFINICRFVCLCQEKEKRRMKRASVY